MSVLVAFSVTPLGVGEGVGEIVADAVRVIPGVRVAEQDRLDVHRDRRRKLGQVMAVVERAVEAVAARGSTGQRGDQSGLALRSHRRDDHQDRVC